MPRIARVLRSDQANILRAYAFNDGSKNCIAVSRPSDTGLGTYTRFVWEDTDRNFVCEKQWMPVPLPPGVPEEKRREYDRGTFLWVDFREIAGCYPRSRKDSNSSSCSTCSYKSTTSPRAAAAADADEPTPNEHDENEMDTDDSSIAESTPADFAKPLFPSDLPPIDVSSIAQSPADLEWIVDSHGRMRYVPDPFACTAGGGGGGKNKKGKGKGRMGVLGWIRDTQKEDGPAMRTRART